MKKVFLLGFAAALAALGQPSGDRYGALLKPALTRILAEQKAPGLAVGIIENGRLQYAAAFGVMKIGEDKPVTSETLFHMASVTKLFVGTSLLQLWEQGWLDLDQPVTKYVPYFRLSDPRAAQITLRQMLSHISGMPDVQDYAWNKPQTDDGALERYVRSIGKEKLRWAPGTKFAYSNMAYEVLGDVIAKVSGESFEGYVKNHILKPLGMRWSTVLLAETDATKMATGHTTKGGAVRVVAHYPYNREHGPSSNLHSNVVDMAQWALANLRRGEWNGTRVLRASTYDLLWREAVPVRDGAAVGVSWFLNRTRGQKIVFHNGGDDGFLTRLALFPETGRAIVYMTNCDFLKMSLVDDVLMKAVFGE